MFTSSARHRIKSLRFEPKKQGGKWIYGQLDVQSLPLSRTDHLLVAERLYPIVVDAVILEKKGKAVAACCCHALPIPAVVISTAATFFKALLVCVCALPPQLKFQLILRASPTNLTSNLVSNTLSSLHEWQFVDVENKPVSLKEILETCLYDDLKTGNCDWLC